MILVSERHGQIYHDAIFRSLPELREKYPEINEQAAIALRDYVAKIRETGKERGEVNVKEPTLRFSGSASSFYGNTLYFSTIIHVGADYILLETSHGRREAVMKSQIENIEWAPTDLSGTVTVEPPKDRDS